LNKRFEAQFDGGLLDDEPLIQDNKISDHTWELRTALMWLLSMLISSNKEKLLPSIFSNPSN
jgi:hypothetical protein